MYLDFMEYRNGFVFNWKNMGVFIFLALLPNFLGMINLPTIYGFKIHFFQIGVFIAALMYGSKGGFVAGAIGSVFSTIIMNNPVILIGNTILGFTLGKAFELTKKPFLSLGIAFTAQLLFLIPADILWIGLSMAFVIKLIIALAASNIIWMFLAVKFVK